MSQEKYRQELIGLAGKNNVKIHKQWNAVRIRDAIIDAGVKEGFPKEPPPQQVPEGFVLCTVTKKGRGKISTGKLAPEPTVYDWKDEVVLPSETAISLEERGFAEIHEDVEADE